MTKLLIKIKGHLLIHLDFLPERQEKRKIQYNLIFEVRNLRMDVLLSIIPRNRIKGCKSKGV